MRFEMFDRDEARQAQTRQADGLLVKVDTRDRMLFCRAVRHFLSEQYGVGSPLEVALLFDAEARAVAVRPLTHQDAMSMPAGQRWKTSVMRSMWWPLAVTATEFLEHYQVGAGDYRVQLVRGPGPRLAVFEVGSARGQDGEVAMLAEI